MTDKTLNIIARGKDETSGALSGVGAAVVGVGAAVVGVGAAITAGFVEATKAITDLTLEAVSAENIGVTFDNLTSDIGGQALALEKLGEATRGMVSETDLMAASNKFMAMGITDSIEGTAEMSEMATQLGMAMGEDATSSMENFALMMANQSIPRLDSFGISSSAVRSRIAELQEETEGLSREQAFNQAVMEQGALAMERLGEQGDTSAAALARTQASVDDLKMGIGEQFIPVAEQMFSDVFSPLLDDNGPKLIEWAGVAAQWIGEKLPVAIEFFGDIWQIISSGFEAVNRIWSNELHPALTELAEALGIDTEAVGDAVGGIDWLDFILKSVNATVMAVVYSVRIFSMGIDAARLGVEWIHSKMEGFERTLQSLRGWLQDVSDWVSNLGDNFMSLEIPDWLTPGSPTPFEIGLRGIGDAIAGMPDMPFDFNVNGASVVGGGRAVTSGTVYEVHNHFGRDSVRSDQDILDIADAIANAMTIRGVQPAL